jgi:plastocyanin
LVSAVLSLAILAILGTSAMAANQTITIDDRAFSPRSVEVGLGELVTWQNNDEVDHTVTVDGALDIGPIPPGGSHAVSFGRAGTFEYGCTIHSGMKGTLTVLGAAGATPEPEPTAAPAAKAAPVPKATVAPTDTIDAAEGSETATLAMALATILAASAAAFGLAFLRVPRDLGSRRRG